jgi:ATP-grasp in the biosynthetic pathway with Ter operon
MTDFSDGGVLGVGETTTMDHCALDDSLHARTTDRDGPAGTPQSAFAKGRSEQSLADQAQRGRNRARPDPVRVLIVAATYALPYRVLRCAHTARTEVYVLGNLGAQVLALSRYCRKFTLSHTIIAGHYDEDLAFEINCVARELGITMILPGDAAGTRTLIACRHLLEFPCFPLPGLEEFDLLNDKWRFARLCETAGRLAYPVVAKARSFSASQGQVVLNRSDAAEQVRRINYRPIIVQEFIAGRDIVASIYCRRGKVVAFIAHRYRRGVYTTFRGDAVFDDLTRIAAHVGAEGVYCFDMIAGNDGKTYYLECNPRFYYSMNLSMLAGINFVELGLQDDVRSVPLRLPDGTTVRRPEAVLTSPRCLPRLTRRDWAAARYTCSDPLPHLLDMFGWPT